MGIPAAGEVVIVPFPFSDLSQSKVRPALCLAPVGRGDWILCQVTSQSFGDPQAIPLNASDFQTGGLRSASFVRPGKLFTAHQSLVHNSVGTMTGLKLDEVLEAVARFLKPPRRN